MIKMYCTCKAESPTARCIHVNKHDTQQILILLALNLVDFNKSRLINMTAKSFETGMQTMKKPDCTDM